MCMLCVPGPLSAQDMSLGTRLVCMYMYVHAHCSCHKLCMALGEVAILCYFMQPPPDLSIVPLDSTTSQFEALPLDLPSVTTSHSVLAGVSDLASLQSQLSIFHDSVCALVQQHVTASTQVHLWSTCVCTMYRVCTIVLAFFICIEDSHTHAHMTVHAIYTHDCTCYFSTVI